MQNTVQTAEEIVGRYQKEMKNVRVMGLLTFVVFAFLLWRFADMVNIVVALVAVAIFYVAIQFLRGMESQQFMQLEQILNEECDPEKYVQVLNMLLPKAKRNANLMHLCKAKGLYYSGRYQEGKAELQNFYERKPSVGFSALYHNTAFLCTLALGEMEEAKAERQKFAETMQRLRPNERGAMLWQAMSMDAAMALEEKRYDEFFPLQRQSLEETNVLMQQVMAMYRLGLGELARGDVEAAREHLGLVAEEGGTMFVVEEARKLLESNRLPE